MNKNVMPRLLVLALVLSAAAGLAACGQRVMPKEPDGKIIPSSQY